MRLYRYRVSMTLNWEIGMSQTLVLNASYEPLNITTWRRAIILMLKGKAESLEEDFSYMTSRCLEIQNNILLGLEGGYNLDALCECCVAVVNELVQKHGVN